jgi:hypothetical protein
MAKRVISKVSVEGLDRLLKTIEPEHLYGDPVRDLLDWGRREGERLAEGRAPRATGRLAGSITSTLKASGAQPHAVIQFSRLASDNGFRYPHALNSSRKFRRSVTVSGASKGKTTYKWFTGVISLVRKAIRSRSKAADAKIESAWKAAK